MKKKSKPFRFGRFVFTRIADEYVYIYTGRKKVYVKTFSFNKPLLRDSQGMVGRFLGIMTLKRASAVIVAVIIALSVNAFFSGPVPSESLNEDDEQKLSILTSSATDFSEPVKEEKPLQITEHIVKKGETLSHIAQIHGISIDTICGSNNLTSYDYISVGTRLKIPNKDGILYKMTRGAQLVGVAKKYNVSLEKILNENSIPNQDFIAVNSVLFIPDAKPNNIVRGFMWPTASRFITCGYGWRKNPFNRSYSEFHQGLDIRSSYQWIKSSMYGQVTYTGWMGGYGNTIIIAHPGGYKTLYAHLSRITVKNGQYVKQGQTIGQSGNTGRSTGAHLHFEVMRNGRHINPYTMLNKKN